MPPWMALGSAHFRTCPISLDNRLSNAGISSCVPVVSRVVRFFPTLVGCSHASLVARVVVCGQRSRFILVMGTVVASPPTTERNRCPRSVTHGRDRARECARNSDARLWDARHTCVHARAGRYRGAHGTTDTHPHTHAHTHTHTQTHTRTHTHTTQPKVHDLMTALECGAKAPPGEAQADGSARASPAAPPPSQTTTIKTRSDGLIYTSAIQATDVADNTPTIRNAMRDGHRHCGQHRHPRQHPCQRTPIHTRMQHLAQRRKAPGNWSTDSPNQSPPNKRESRRPAGMACHACEWMSK